MRNAAIDRLSKILSDDPEQNGDRRAFNWSDVSLSLYQREGWFSLFLLALIVYCGIWCIQANDWVDNSGALSLTALVGILYGTWSVKQRFFAAWLVYSMAAVIGLLLIVWQISITFYGGSLLGELQGIGLWFIWLVTGHTNEDPALYFMIILLLGYLLAYISALLLYRWCLPWLLVAMNGVVLVLSLNGLNQAYVFFLFLFLAASLLLLLRFNLYTSTQRWEGQGLHYADDLGWGFMQTGIVISLGIILLSALLPADYEEMHLAQIWSSQTPLGLLANALDRGSNAGISENAPNPGNFTDNLVLGGNPHLNNAVVFKVKVDASQPQYLALVSYNTYDHGWSISGSNQNYHIGANTLLATNDQKTYAVTQDITVVTPPGEQQPYLVGASDVVKVSVAANILDGSGGIVTWLGEKNLQPNTHYTAVSAVSSADVSMLRSIPMPADAPSYRLTNSPDAQAPIEYFVPSIVQDFTQMPTYLKTDKQIAALTRSIVSQAHATTMYDKAVALETYLRTHYSYSTDIHPPLGEDPILWFLFDNKQQNGYCNYFSTAMALMARSLGIPAREVAGYAPGTYDSPNDQYIVHGMDAHSWTQVYFAGYGWVNFEPSASFKTFVRPLPDQSIGSSSSITGAGGGITPAQAQKARNRNIDQPETGGSGATHRQQAASLYNPLNITIACLLLLLLLASGSFFLWWQRLFKSHSLATQLYGRVSLLAGWAGIRRQSSQTPYEYVQQLSSTVTYLRDDAQLLEQLADVYVRERWSDPNSSDYLQHSGEIHELPALWRQIRLHLFAYLLRHPVFLRWIPDRMIVLLKRMRKKQ
ncbi:DUF4129 domain-containing transglutaminase family protein [Dictyobacter arantiisoli]|uniref:Transglutaminase-like domain-containing protein n=1 Tax=Dictyobacter arantiisoli TaxID=2014874 RepID=A0A5A5T8S2_9CHLR|nr:transglutaminase domain-containing protein [Dictyobacter arantiisoli]GCF07880.1 hypothetical protein KDI_14440 [Dictyobacter arantiisoli]